jgi:hypothetical protein
LEFQERFATEDACREYLFASRWPECSSAPAAALTDEVEIDEFYLGGHGAARQSTTYGQITRRTAA